MRPCRARFGLLPLLLLIAGAPARADDPAFTLTLKDHKFTPVELTVPANVRFRLTVKNEDPTPAEFESHDFRAERVVAGGHETTLTLGPLKPGSYGFFDDYHEKDTKGRLVAQ